ncbi:protein of unknown function [Aquiflexum balticum DSM 16537]|uniref:DUF4403 family protein n=1 Tax=Aquiflexum balticum DSM 16537 TaxID=758820 RepID=A0A1W2H036_9BACT|nr:DUF4403 family protein [Aquiflexum balticum]SMD42241.1 protein of unknown function [Aquiflexum balticum DSM 16537]
MKFQSIKLLFIFTILLHTSCKSIKPDRPPAATMLELPSSRSTVNIPIVIPLSYLEDNLNKDWSSKLFADKGLPLGGGLSADLDVTRTGKISLRGSENNTINVKVPMNIIGDLKIEKKVFGQNLSTNFPFNENLSPEISFIPVIGQNWDLNIQNLQINSWGRSMKYNLLGFEIDLDPLVRNQLQKVLDNQLKAANLSQLDFKHMAQETWDAFSDPYTVEQNGITAHFYSVPDKIMVKEEITPDQELILYLGLEGEMFSKLGSKPNIVKKDLPNISVNESKENQIDLVLPLTISYNDLDEYLNTTFSGQQIRTNNTTLIFPSNLKTQKYGDKTLLSMDFKAVRDGKKDVEGKMYFAGKPVFDKNSESLIFEEPQFDVKTGDFFSDLGIRFRKGKIQRQIKKIAVLPIGELLNNAQNEMAEHGYFETDFANFKVLNPSLDVEGIYSTAEDIRVFIRSQGKMDVQLKDLK